VLVEALTAPTAPAIAAASSSTYIVLARVFKQINAPFGQFGVDTLKISTAALSSNTPNDSEYTVLEGKLTAWRSQRDTLAAQMKTLLAAGAPSPGTSEPQSADQLIAQGKQLLSDVKSCLANIPACAGQ
jgi:hypothetical protein